METPRLKLVYLVLLPALVIATCVLGYYTNLTARQFERLGEQSIAESSLLLLQDKAERIEQLIIAADNLAFGAIDLEDDESVQHWKNRAVELSPSVRALLVLDEDRRIHGYAARASAADQRAFRKLFMTQMLKDLELDKLEPNRLMHLHRSYGGRNYLISYKSAVHDEKTFYFVAHHDTGYLVRSVFSDVLRNEPGQPLQNVVDQDGHRVFGPSLLEGGDYVVGRRFPTTLYLWRLQAAPTSAPLLKEKRHTSRINQVALIALSLAVIVIAVGFILYAADKESRLAAMKSDFIANVSHELKTPLSVIRMFGEMLLSRRVFDESKRDEYLEIICSETERLSGLIENVLDFAALERGKKRYEMRDCDLAEIAKRAIDTLHYRFEREGITVSLQQLGDPPHALLDDQAMLLVIINLLDNAVKYGGGTPVNVSVETLDREVRLIVRDHGPGIEVSDRKRVFERFYRTKSARNARGSGIGLAIVKRIAEEHHGRVWAASAPDGGAVVGFAIPRAGRAGASAAQAEPGGRGATIDSDRKPADIVARNG